MPLPAFVLPNPNPLPPLVNPPNDVLALIFPTAGEPLVGGNDWAIGVPKEKGFPPGAGVDCEGAAPKLNDGVD